MCTHSICFERKYENSKNKSSENYHFNSREKSLYIAWACFRNVLRLLKDKIEINEQLPGTYTLRNDLRSQSQKWEQLKLQRTDH